MQYTQHQEFIIDQVEKQNIRKSRQADIPTTGRGLGEPLGISNYIGSALVNNVDEGIAKAI